LIYATLTAEMPSLYFRHRAAIDSFSSLIAVTGQNEGQQPIAAESQPLAEQLIAYFAIDAADFADASFSAFIIAITPLTLLRHCHYARLEILLAG